MIYKKFILGLLVLVGLSSILFKPGNGIFENYVRRYSSQDVKNLRVSEYANFYFKYPPLVQIVFTKILQAYPVSKNLDHFDFYASPAYFLFKVSLYISYLAAFVSLVYSGKLFKKKVTNFFLHSGLSYFGSVSIILISLALTYYDIYAVPLLIFTYIFLLKRMNITASTLYIISLLINWMLIVFAPIFLLISLKTQKKSKFAKLYGLVSYCFVPGFLLALFFGFLLFDKTQFIVNNFSPKAFSLYWFTNQPLEYLSKITSHKVEIEVISGLVAMSVFVAANLFAGHLVNNLFFRTIKYKFRFLRLLPYLLTATIFFISLLFTNSLFLPFLGLFIAYYAKLLVIFVKKNDYSVKSVTSMLFLITSLYLLLCPLVTEGNLLWLVVISLLNHFLYQNKESKLVLILVNVFVFINFFIYFGASGYVPVPGLYFESFRYLIFALYILFLVSNVNKLSADWLK